MPKSKVKPIQPNLETPASDNNYVDLSIINNTTIPYKPAVYSLNRAVEVLPKANDFYISIEEVSIPSALLPSIVLSLIGPIVLDTVTFTPITSYALLFNGVTYNIPAPYSNSDVWNINPEYQTDKDGLFIQYVYSLKLWIATINIFIQRVMLGNAIDPTTYPINFQINDRGVLQLYVHPQLITTNVLTSLGISRDLYFLMGSNLPIYVYNVIDQVVEFNLTQITTNIQTQQYWNGPDQAQLPRRLLLFEGDLNIYKQCNPIKRIVIESIDLPTNRQVDANHQSSKPNYVLTFQPMHVNADSLDGNLTFDAVHPHNFVDLITDRCMREIGYKVYWEDWNKQLHVVRIPIYTCLTIRALCRKKICECDKQDDTFM